MSGYINMDAASQCRVNTGLVLNIAGARMNLQTATQCGAGACGLNRDIYGRLANPNSLFYGTDSVCANYSVFPSSRVIAIESSLRPAPRCPCPPLSCVADQALGLSFDAASSTYPITYGVDQVAIQANTM